MAGCRINLCYEELVIARTCRLTVYGRPVVRSNGCETIDLRFIDARKKLVVTRSVPLAWGFVAGRLLGSYGYICRSRGLCLGLYGINVFGVWVECVKDLLVNVCYGTAKSAEIGSRDMRVSTGQHAYYAVGVPFINRFVCVGGVLVGDCSRLSQVRDDWTRWPCGVYRTTTQTVQRGQFPIYIWIFVEFF